MLNFIKNKVVKWVIPFIISKLDLDIDTVERKDGKYLRVRIKLIDIIAGTDITILDRLLNVYNGKGKAKNIDVREFGNIKLPIDLRGKLTNDLAEHIAKPQVKKPLKR